MALLSTSCLETFRNMLVGGLAVLLVGLLLDVPDLRGLGAAFAVVSPVFGSIGVVLWLFSREHRTGPG